MATPNIAKWKDFTHASTFCQRMRRAYPRMKFEVLNHPQEFYWAVARMADNGFRVRAWVARPRGPLPGELPVRWEYEYRNDGKLLVGSVFLSRDTTRRSVMIAAKKACDLRGVRGSVKWAGSVARFKPYGRNSVLTISTVVS